MDEEQEKKMGLVDRRFVVVAGCNLCDELELCGQLCA